MLSVQTRDPVTQPSKTRPGPSDRDSSSTECRPSSVWKHREYDLASFCLAAIIDLWTNVKIKLRWLRIQTTEGQGIISKHFRSLYCSLTVLRTTVRSHYLSLQLCVFVFSEYWLDQSIVAVVIIISNEKHQMHPTRPLMSEMMLSM